MLQALGGEAGCERLAAEFYRRVATDPVLRPLFPGKSLRCATEEFAAFLIQFLDGDESRTQARWWLSLRESHARFSISAEQRAAWLRHMSAALQTLGLDPALNGFFQHSSQYVIGGAAVECPLFGKAWTRQLALDEIIAGDVEKMLAMAPRFSGERPGVFAGLLARMLRREAVIPFVLDSLRANPSLTSHSFGGRTILHYACGSGCMPVVTLLVRELRMDPNVLDRGGHTPLYAVANESGSADLVRLLIEAGADVNASGGVTHATALHMAARRGHVEAARALLDAGASLTARDRKGATPLDRALNCRKAEVARLLSSRI